MTENNNEETVKHSPEKPVLSVKDLEIAFKTFAGWVEAIRGVSFDLYQGETLALVGESGSGKSVTTKAIMGLLSKNAQVRKGQILYQRDDLLTYSNRKMQGIRGSKIAMIFQDPMTALNPTLTIGRQIMEVLSKHRGMNRSQALDEAIDLLGLCGIDRPQDRLNHYPHEFSGGQRQRIVIAIALAGDPDILIADEPTTALDVTIQAQIIELIKEIQALKQMSVIFITHDLGVVANVADRVAVMYAGKIVEIGSVDAIYYYPQHPYTWGLLSAMPTLETRAEDLDEDTDQEEKNHSVPGEEGPGLSKRQGLYAIPGTPPNLLHPPKGDAFAYRNEYALAVDFEYQPPFFKVGPGHYAATWLLHPEAPKVDLPANIQARHRYYQNKLAYPQGGDHHV